MDVEKTMEFILRQQAKAEGQMAAIRKLIRTGMRMIVENEESIKEPANRDPRQFLDAGRFNVSRDPNPHVSFGHGIHFCLGAALARMESKIALSDLLERFKNLELATDQPWQPREALNVYGPAHLPVRFEVNRRAAALP